MKLFYLGSELSPLSEDGLDQLQDQHLSVLKVELLHNGLEVHGALSLC